MAPGFFAGPCILAETAAPTPLSFVTVENVDVVDVPSKESLLSLIQAEAYAGEEKVLYVAMVYNEEAISYINLKRKDNVDPITYWSDLTFYFERSEA